MERQKKSSPFERRKAKDLLAQGLTRREIARRLKRRETTVTSWLTGLGGEVRRPWTEDDTKAVLTMRAAGCRWKDVCVALQRREETIRAALRRRGVKAPHIYASKNRRLLAGLPPEKPAKKSKEKLPFERPHKAVSWKKWHAEKEKERRQPEKVKDYVPVFHDPWADDAPIGGQP
jgi:IS30 family transposase